MGRISMPQGKGSQLHNRRDYEKIGREIPDNIDANLSAENVTLVDRDIREAYQEIFGEALQKYNDKQKRADRKIEDYYDHISKSKNGEKLFYEDVLQFGKKEDFENNPQLKEKAKDCLEEYARSFQERNPNLKVIGAYIHMDEASPHLHIDYVPVAHGYSRGLETRNSLDKAMKEMGFQPEKESRKNNATKLWKESERAYFGEICRSRGLEVEAERKARGSLSVEEYKEARDNMLGGIEKEMELMEQKLATNSEALDQQADKLKKGQEAINKVDAINYLMAQKGKEDIRVKDYIIPEKKGLFGKIEAPEEQGVFVKGMNKEQVKALVQRDRVDEGLERSFDNVQVRVNSTLKRAHNDAEGIKNEAREQASQIIEQGQQEANLRLQQAQMQIVEANRILAQKEKLQKELYSLNRKKQELAPEVEALSQEEARLKGNIRAYSQGWTDSQGNLHKGLEELKMNYREASEKLAEVQKAIDSKIDIAMQDFKPEEVKQMLNDSMVSNLVQEAMMQTCNQLEDKGLLKTSSNMAFLELDKKKVTESLRDRVEDFIDKVKEHMQELAERVVHRYRGR